MNKVNIEKAYELLKENKIVAIPTETVYGLAGIISSKQALELIFKTKGRPLFDPLIVHVSDIEMAKTLTDNWNKTCDVLARAFWPGPLTLILEKNNKVDPLITAGLKNVGIRMPSHPLTLELIEKLNSPIAAPSANKFKKTSPTSALHVHEEFGEAVPILDGGSSEIGIESTVAQVFENEIVIYRPGKVTAGAIKNALLMDGLSHIDVRYGSSPVAPGQLDEHYRPDVPLILLDANSPYEMMKNKVMEAGIKREKIMSFKLPSSPELAARIIYAKMRELSKEKPSAIAFYLPTSIHTDENWLGVINRLIKASSFNFLSI